MRLRKRTPIAPQDPCLRHVEEGLHARHPVPPCGVRVAAADEPGDRGLELDRRAPAPVPVAPEALCRRCERDGNGDYPQGTLNARVEGRLVALAERRISLAAEQREP